MTAADHDTGTPARRREPATVRVAIWSARHRWIVLAAWFIGTIGLFVSSGLLGGQQTQSIMSNGAAIGESVAGWRAFSDAGKAESTELFYVIVSNPAGTLDTAAGRAAVASIAAKLAAASATVDGASEPVFAPDPARNNLSVVDPFVLAAVDPRAAAFILSADHSSVLIDARIAGNDVVALAKTESLKPLLAQLKADHPDLAVLTLNNRLINDDFGDYINDSLDGLLLLTLPLTFLILLVAFRALVAAFVPMVLAVSAIAGAMGLVGIYSHAIGPVSQYANQIVVLIGLAVAVDYSLFVVTRFRTERSRGRDRVGSIEVASATAGRAVFFSGLAVMISLSGLLLIDEQIFHSIAVGAIAVVLISVVGSLSFLPAALSLLDRRVNLGTLPLIGRDRGEGRGFWAAIVRGATARPVIACVATAALLLVATTPLARLQLGSTTNDVSILPTSIEGVRAWALLNEKWPKGSSLTLDLIVTNVNGPNVPAAIGRLEDSASAVPGVGGPARTSLSGDRTVADVAFTLPGSPNDRANWDIVRQFRTGVVPAAFAGVPASRAYVSGDAAYSLDYGDWYGSQTPLVIGFVLGLSFLLLLVAFHSIVIAVKAILLNLLSAGSAFGVLILVFQEGWLRDVTGVKPGVIEAWAPVMIFTILFGLSMDYHVFILTRVKEARDRGLSSTDAVVKGITITSGTVTSAAAIMVCVFAAFFTIRLTVIQELGLGLAVAVLIDATLVRSLLLPSTMKLLGDWNWWMPRFLHWIPRVTIEGDPEDAVDGDVRTPLVPA